MKILLREGETLDEGMARFKRCVKSAGILEAYKRHDYFLKKSLRRKEKSKAAALKSKKKAK